MSDLKACPFCGKFGIQVGSDGLISDVKTNWASCCDHHCMGIDIFFSVETWQSRPIEDALRAELEQAREAISAMWPIFSLALSYAEHGRTSEIWHLKKIANEFRYTPPAGVVDTILRACESDTRETPPPAEGQGGL